MPFILTLLFAGAGLALHARRLPPQNLFAIALLVFGSATAVEWSAQVWGIPFTPFPLNNESFWCLPIGWIGAIMFARKIAQTFFGPRRGSSNYGLWVLTTTVLMSAAFWSLAETILAGFILLNFVGRLVTSTGILMLVLPWLIEKRPRIYPVQ
ncbi:MAG: hypothetical protein H0X66_14135 [Verrucomicrobia bacterium]|nr:hypothetical protein [Verrucomicrobiota bacterium]